MSANYNGEALIRVENLGKSFGAIHVLSGINVDIHAGDVVFVARIAKKAAFMPRSRTTSRNRAGLSQARRAELPPPGCSGRGRQWRFDCRMPRKKCLAPF